MAGGEAFQQRGLEHRGWALLRIDGDTLILADSVGVSTH